MERSLAGAAFHLKIAGEALRSLESLPLAALQLASTGSMLLLLGDCADYEREARWLLADFCDACRAAAASPAGTIARTEE